MKHPTLPPVSSEETWDGTIRLTDRETGEGLFEYDDDDTWPSAVTLKVRDEDNDSTVLEGSLSGGELTIVGDGRITFEFSDLTALAPKTYTVGILYTTAAGIKRQYLLGRLPVLEGL